jgi:hypothetical protein
VSRLAATATSDRSDSPSDPTRISTDFDQAQVHRSRYRNGRYPEHVEGPVGLGFGPLVFGRGNYLYIAALNLATFWAGKRTKWSTRELLD